MTQPYSTQLRPLCAVALWLFWSGTSGSAAEAPKDPLWLKAVAVATTNANWVPGLIVTRAEILHKGKVVAVHELWQRSTLGPDGEVVTETVRMLEDGKDVTKGEKPKPEPKSKSREKGGTKKPDGQTAGNPFAAQVQDQVSLKVLDQARTIGDRSCAAYAFELRNPDGSTLKGTAWLDRETGVPAEIVDMTVDPLPDKHLKRLTLATQYETTTNGVWCAKTVTSTSTISVMLIKADAKTTTTFSEHWKKP